MLSSLLGLRQPFPCSRVFCSKLSFNFWLHKGRFRPGLGSNNYHASQGQDAMSIVGHSLAFVPPPRTLTQWHKQ